MGAIIPAKILGLEGQVIKHVTFNEDNGEWVLCRSEHQALFERRSEKEIAAITQEIRKLPQLGESNRGVNASAVAAFTRSKLKKP